MHRKIRKISVILFLNLCNQRALLIFSELSIYPSSYSTGWTVRSVFSRQDRTFRSSSNTLLLMPRFFVFIAILHPAFNPEAFIFQWVIKEQAAAGDRKRHQGRFPHAALRSGRRREPCREHVAKIVANLSQKSLRLFPHVRDTNGWLDENPNWSKNDHLKSNDETHPLRSNYPFWPKGTFLT